jgi:hypothetical protein
MCTIGGDYVKMLVPMAPAPLTHTYQLVMTSAAAQKEFMLRVDTLSGAPRLCQAWACGHQVVVEQLKVSA